MVAIGAATGVTTAAATGAASVAASGGATDAAVGATTGDVTTTATGGASDPATGSAISGTTGGASVAHTGVVGEVEGEQMSPGQVVATRVDLEPVYMEEFESRKRRKKNKRGLHFMLPEHMKVGRVVGGVWKPRKDPV